jgi:hypothetical protein
MTIVIPPCPPDLLGPALFVEKVVGELDRWGMVRIAPSLSDIFDAVRTVSRGEDRCTLEQLKLAEAQRKNGEGRDPIKEPGTAAPAKAAAKTKCPGQYSDRELSDLLAQEEGNKSAVARRLGCTPRALRYQLQKRGLMEPGSATRKPAPKSK